MRNYRRGIILLSTLLSLLLLASVAAVLQQRVSANLKVMATLDRQLRSGPAEAAIRERLRAILGDAVSNLPVEIAGFNMRGDPFIMQEAGKKFSVTVNDVDGLIDVYLASPVLRELLPSGARITDDAQKELLAALPPGTRFPVLEASLAHLGMMRGQRSAAFVLLTQSSENGQLRVETAPRAIAEAASALSPLEVKVGQVVRFRIRIEEAGEAGTTGRESGR